MVQSENGGGMSSNVDVAVKLQANLDPLVNAAPKALDKIFNALFPKSARRATLSTAQNQVDMQKILEGKASFNQETGALMEFHDKYTEICDLVRKTLQEEEITNLISCAIHAADNIQDVQSASDVNLSTDFLNRWRSEAKFVSEETAQAVWGKILSEEIKKPNSISARTLDVIKGLTREEAEAFRDACKFVFFDQYLMDSAVDGNPIPQKHYVMLHDAGLIAHYQKGIYRGFNWPETGMCFPFEENLTKLYFLQVGKIFLFVEQEKIQESPMVNYWQLTKAGREMHRIISREIEYDVVAVGMAVTEGLSELKSLLKYAVYTNTEEQRIDLNTIQFVFSGESP